MLTGMTAIIDLHRPHDHFSVNLFKRSTMKNFITALFCFISIAVVAPSKPTRRSGGDEAAILKVLDKQKAAWNRGDIDGFMKGYWENDSLMFVGKSGVTYGWTNTLNNYKKGYPDTAA